MTELDIARHIRHYDSCFNISCTGTSNINKGTPCPFYLTDKSCAYEKAETSILAVVADRWIKAHEDEPTCRDKLKAMVDKCEEIIGNSRVEVATRYEMGMLDAAQTIFDAGKNHG